jgi:hypothetical protein
MMKENTPCFEYGEPAVFNHHVIPKSQGGKHTVPLCPACHGIVHSRTFTVNYREIIKQAMARAKARGVQSGPKHKLTPLQVTTLREQRAAGVLIKDLMLQYGLSKASVYRYLDGMQPLGGQEQFVGVVHRNGVVAH